MDESPPDETTGQPLPGPHLASETDEFTPLRLVLQPTGAVLEVTRPDVVVGRHSHADVRVALPDVSRRHCRLVHDGGRWEVIDLKSLNGIWVNDQAVERAALNHGDTLRIGGFTFMVDLSKPVAVADPKSGVLRSIFSALPPADGEEREPRRRAS
jgi:pSer/pThr/pTyr-binding forkhead associated (FHA) protein